MSLKVKIESVNGKPIEEYGYKREFVDVSNMWHLKRLFQVLLKYCIVQERDAFTDEQISAGVNVPVEYVYQNLQREAVLLNTERDIPGFYQYVWKGQFENNFAFYHLLPDLILPEVAFTVVADSDGLVLHKIDLKTGEQQKYTREAAPSRGITEEVRFVDWRGRTARQEANDALLFLDNMARKFTPNDLDIAYAMDGFFSNWEERHERHKLLAEVSDLAATIADLGEDLEP